MKARLIVDEYKEKHLYLITATNKKIDLTEILIASQKAVLVAICFIIGYITGLYMI